MARRRRYHWEQDWEQERLLEELDAAYRTLGIEPADATVATVQAAWRELVKQHHTDFGGVHATIAAINAARDIILTDLEKNKGTLTTKLKRRRKPSSAAPEDDAEAGPEFVWPGDADPPPAPG